MFQNKLFGDKAFHGDEYLLRLIDYLMHRCNYFIETGTHRGDSFAYIVYNYPNCYAIGCEPNYEYLTEAIKKVNNKRNYYIDNRISQDFLPSLDIIRFQNEPVLFWLDAHGHGFAWPLAFEVEFITTNFNKAFILIDDFQVPEKPQFGYDNSTGNICSYETIKKYIKNNYQVYYPNYNELTPKTMGLVGWGLLVKDWEIPEELRDIIKDGIQGRLGSSLL